MKVDQLTNLQLYSLYNNKANNSFIRTITKREFENRKINNVETNDLLSRHSSITKKENQKPLPTFCKILLLLLAPIFSSIFLMILHNIAATVLLDKGYFKMQKQYWFFVTLSYLLWTLVLLATSKTLLS